MEYNFSALALQRKYKPSENNTLYGNDQIESKVCYISTFKCYALVEHGSNSIWSSGNELLSMF